MTSKGVPSTVSNNSPRCFVRPTDLPHQGIERGCAQRPDQSGLDKVEFSAQPPGTGAYFAYIGAGVKASLASGFELEMLDGIGDVAERSVDVRFVQAFVEQPTGRPDERPPGQIFAITGLFTDKDDGRVFRAFSEYDLCRVPVEIASAAVFGVTVQFADRGTFCVIGAEDRR